MNSKFEKFLKAELAGIRDAGLYRTMRRIEGPVGPSVMIDGRELILLSSNNYLGLAAHPAVQDAARRALEEYGTGAGASRLLSGNLAVHQELEARLARFKHTEAALVFSSGYAANVGLISSLAGPQDIIFSDQLNHASIIDGCRLSRAQVRVFSHSDISHLEKILQGTADAVETGRIRHRFIITDGLFSMDGDVAPVPDLLQMAQKHNAVLILDDAHATGVLGKDGAGTASHFGIESPDCIQMGTFSKALGSLGGFVAGTRDLIDYLRNRSRSFIYSTALPPPVCAASLAALDLVENGDRLRKALADNVDWLKQGLDSLGFDTMGSRTQIIPIVIGESEITMDFARNLFEHGVLAPGIRPPTVPEGTCRIRATLMATHTSEQIDKVLDVFESVGRKLGIV